MRNSARCICFTGPELDALEDFFPRITVSNVVHEGSAAHSAIEKLFPAAIPTSYREKEFCKDGMLVADCDACAIDGYCSEIYGTQ